MSEEFYMKVLHEKFQGKKSVSSRYTLSRELPSKPPLTHHLPKLHFFNKFIYFWLCWVFVAARAFSRCGQWGRLFVAVRGLLIAVASLVVEHGL